MESEDIFLAVVAVLLLFNVFLIFMNPSLAWDMTLAGLTGFVAVILTTGILLGIQVFGTGLNSQSIKIAFGIGAILNILFQIDIAGFRIGLGLATNMLNQFSATDGLGIGWILATVISVMALVSGLVILTD